MTGRQRDEAEKWIQKNRPPTFEQWLKPNNLSQLRASQFLTLPDVEKTHLSALDKELQVNGVVGFMNI
jgi:hypothetical protein